MLKRRRPLPWDAIDDRWSDLTDALSLHVEDARRRSDDAPCRTSHRLMGSGTTASDGLELGRTYVVFSGPDAGELVVWCGRSLRHPYGLFIDLECRTTWSALGRTVPVVELSSVCGEG